LHIAGSVSCSARRFRILQVAIAADLGTV
jgi:hypothetical protein